MMASSNSSTVLRVKRPRHVAPLETLRVDLSDKKRQKSNLTQLLHTSTYISAQQQQQQTCVVWKRFHESTTNSHGDKNKRVHYVDARIDQEDDEPQTKKRRLALTLLVNKNEKDNNESPSLQKLNTTAKGNNKLILDPLSRLVDDSLKQVFEGTQTVSQHVHFIETDERLVHSKHKNWLSWCTGTNGNVLHAAAVLNDVEGAQQVLQKGNAEKLVRVQDGDGKTPLEVATLVGHEGLAQVFESYMEEQHDNKEEEEQDFVYDFFGLVPQEENKDFTPDSDKDDTSIMTPPTAELRGGIGYWNDKGDLVLEALESTDMMDKDDSDMDDDDVDSNAEDYDGNDYPDELNHLWQDNDDESSSSSSFDHDTSYRNRPVVLGGGHHLGLQRDGRVGVVLQQKQHHSYLYNDEEDEDGYYDNIVEEYDYYQGSNPQPERLYAYDPEYDDKDNHHD